LRSFSVGWLVWLAVNKACKLLTNKLHGVCYIYSTWTIWKALWMQLTYNKECREFHKLQDPKIQVWKILMT
jgi:hypothetical protein